MLGGILSLLVGRVTGDGASWDGVLTGALAGGFGVAVGTAATTGRRHGRAEAAKPVAPEAVRTWPGTRALVVRGAAAVTLLVAASVALSAWWDSELPPGILWIVLGLGAAAEAVDLRAWERTRGGTLAAVRDGRGSWWARLRRRARPAEHVLLRPRVDVTIGDDEGPGAAGR